MSGVGGELPFEVRVGPAADERPADAEDLLPSVVSELIAAPESWFLITVLAAHGCTAPVTPSSEPMPHAWVVLRVLKPPPTMTRPLAGCTTIALTMRSAVGAHGRSAPVVALAAARRVRTENPAAGVPTEVKSPPK